MKLVKILSRNLSLRLYLLVVFAIALLLTVSLVVMFYFSHQTLREEAVHNAEQTLEGTEQQIDNILLSVEQSAGNIYWNMLTHLNQPDRMFTYSRELVECNPYILGCAIAFSPNYYPDRELFLAYVYRREIGSTDLLTASSYGDKPYTEQQWFSESMTSGRVYWREPMKNANNEHEPIITFCLPIIDRSGKSIGVMGVDVSIVQLTQLVESAKPSLNGYVTLLAQDGSFIIHPDTTKLLHQTVFTQLDHGADPAIHEIGNAMLAGETGEKSFSMDGQNCFVFYKPFQPTVTMGRAMNHLNWSVGVIYPENDIYGEYNRLLYYVVVIAFVGLLVFLFLCRQITKYQLRPLQLLTQSAKHMAEGDLNETIPNAERDDELGQLQNSFRQIQRSLIAHVNEQKQEEKLALSMHEQGKVLKKAYEQALQADQVKTYFLHHMVDQMIGPADKIDKSVTSLCNDYGTISMEDADQKVTTIQQQTQAILNLVDSLMFTTDNPTRKEDSHE